jgi:hypothetical protein
MAASEPTRVKFPPTTSSEFQTVSAWTAEVTGWATPPTAAHEAPFQPATVVKDPAPGTPENQPPAISWPLWTVSA